MSNSLQSHRLQHARLLCPPLSPWVCSDSCRLSQWYYLTISFSTAPFSFCLPSFPASGAFPVSQFFPSGGQSTGASASATVLPVNIQDWFSSGLTGLISLQSERLSRVFPSTTIRKYQFFSAQSSLWAISYNHTWLLEKSYIVIVLKMKVWHKGKRRMIILCP